VRGVRHVRAVAVWHQAQAGRAQCVQGARPNSQRACQVLCGAAAGQACCAPWLWQPRHVCRRASSLRRDIWHAERLQACPVYVVHGRRAARSCRRAAGLQPQRARRRCPWTPSCASCRRPAPAAAAARTASRRPRRRARVRRWALHRRRRSATRRCGALVTHGVLCSAGRSGRADVGSLHGRRLRARLLRGGCCAEQERRGPRQSGSVRCGCFRPNDRHCCLMHLQVHEKQTLVSEGVSMALRDALGVMSQGKACAPGHSTCGHPCYCSGLSLFLHSFFSLCSCMLWMMSSGHAQAAMCRCDALRRAGAVTRV